MPYVICCHVTHVFRASSGFLSSWSLGLQVASESSAVLPEAVSAMGHMSQEAGTQLSPTVPNGPQVLFGICDEVTMFVTISRGLIAKRTINKICLPSFPNFPSSATSTLQCKSTSSCLHLQGLWCLPEAARRCCPGHAGQDCGNSHGFRLHFPIFKTCSKHFTSMCHATCFRNFLCLC